MREKLMDIVCESIATDRCVAYCSHPHCGLVHTVVQKLIANGVTIQKWIPVSERLPEEDVRVLVWLGTGDITYTQIDTDRLHKKKWRRWTKNVTRWMPLPEPPAIDK